MQMSRDSLSITHQLPDTPGTYVVRAEGILDDGSSLNLHVTVLVTLPSRDTSTRRNPSTTEFRFGGHTYTLQLRNFVGQATTIASYLSPIDDGRTTLALNFAHSKFAGTDAIRTRVAQLEISLLIASNEERLKPSLSDTLSVTQKVMERASVIYALLANTNS